MIWLISISLVKAQQIIGRCSGVGFPITEEKPVGLFTVPHKYPMVYEWGLTHEDLYQNVVWLKCSNGEHRYFPVECHKQECRASVVRRLTLT